MTKTATIRGIALAPGVSRNGRLYTTENIGAAVRRAQARIKAGQPLTMLTHHGAEDDSTHIVGQVTSMGQDAQGRATFEAALAPTANGKVIKKLVKGPQPYLKGVSIRGRWQGKVRTVNGAETADDLEIEGLDFTHRPGVPDAQILAESAGGRAGGLIFEEAGHVQVTKVTEAAALERAEQAFDTEAAALRALDELALSARTFETLREGRTSPMWAESSLASKLAALGYDDHPVVVAARDAASPSDLAGLSQDDFEAAAAAWAGGKLADMDAARPRSPFMSGLGDSLPAAPGA